MCRRPTTTSFGVSVWTICSIIAPPPPWSVPCSEEVRFCRLVAGGDGERGGCGWRRDLRYELRFLSPGGRRGCARPVSPLGRTGGRNRFQARGQEIPSSGAAEWHERPHHRGWRRDFGH